MPLQEVMIDVSLKLGHGSVILDAVESTLVVAGHSRDNSNDGVLPGMRRTP